MVEVTTHGFGGAPTVASPPRRAAPRGAASLAAPSEAGRGTAATGTYDVSCVASVACTVPASVLSAVQWPVWVMIRDLTFRAKTGCQQEILIKIVAIPLCHTTSQYHWKIIKKRVNTGMIPGNDEH